MGLYKLCKHKDRARDRCKHTWWGAFQHEGKLRRVSLPKWANEEIRTKAQAEKVFDRMKDAVRAGRLLKTEDRLPDGPLTFAKFAETYADKHARAKGLALADTIDYRLKPLTEHFGSRRLADIKTADIEDFIAELRKPRRVSRQTGRRLRPASINRHLELLRHMFNWAVGREYIDRTPFRRGSETLIRPLLEDNKRSRRVSEREEQQLLDTAPRTCWVMLPSQRRRDMTTRSWRLCRQRLEPLRAGRNLTGQNLLAGQTFKNLSRMTPRKGPPTPSDAGQFRR